MVKHQFHRKIYGPTPSSLTENEILNLKPLLSTMAPSESNETMITADTTQRNLEVVQWLLDTRNLWPEASETRHLESVVSLLTNTYPNSLP